MHKHKMRFKVRYVDINIDYNECKYEFNVT